MNVIANISIGNLVTWALTLGGALITIGKLTQLLTTLSREMSRLREDFNAHCRDDSDNFRRIIDRIINLAERGRFAHPDDAIEPR